MTKHEELKLLHLLDNGVPKLLNSRTDAFGVNYYTFQFTDGLTLTVNAINLVNALKTAIKRHSCNPE